MVKYLSICRVDEVMRMRRHALTRLDMFSIGDCAKLLNQYCYIHFKRVFRALERQKATDQ